MNASFAAIETVEIETATGKVIFVDSIETMLKQVGGKQVGRNDVIDEPGLTITVSVNKVACRQNLAIPGHKPGCFDVWVSVQYESIEPTNHSVLTFMIPSTPADRKQGADRPQGMWRRNR